MSFDDGRKRAYPSTGYEQEGVKEETSLIDQFHAGLAIREEVEKTVNTLEQQICAGDDHQHSTVLESMQNNLVVLQIQDRYFYTTLGTLTAPQGTISPFPCISNFGRLTDDSQIKIREELAKEPALFTHCDSKHLQYVHAQENLFKSIGDELKAYDGTLQSIVTLFKERNPNGFYFVLEHLRMGGRVKCLGIDKFDIDLLKCILKESTFFKTDKLTHHVRALLNTHHNSEVFEYESDQPMKSVSGATCVNEIINELKEVEEKIKTNNQTIQKLSTTIAKKYKAFLKDNNREDEFYESEDLAVKLNVSGQKFNMPFRVLARFDNFLISKYIQSPNFKLGLDEHIFVDRNPEMFSLIYSYMMCGKFNHFPPSLSIEKRIQLKRESEFYGLTTLIDEYLDELRYPIELLSYENIQLKERDDWLRKFFVKHRESPILDDMYLTLSPLFEKIEEINSGERFKIDFVKCPKLLDLTNKLKYSRHVEKPQLVNSLITFKRNWFEFTQGLLEGMDWSGVFAAGGGVLGCVLKGNEINADNNTIISEFLPFVSSNDRYDDEKLTTRKDLNLETDEENFNYWKPSLERNENTKTENQSYQHFSVVAGGHGSNCYFNRTWTGLEWIRKQIAEKRRLRGTFGKTSKSKSADSNESNEPLIDNSQAKFIPQPNIPTSFQKSDIDLFLYALSEEEAEEKIKHIYQTIKGNLKKRLVREFTTNSAYTDSEWGQRSPTIDNTGVDKPTEVVDDDVIILRTKYAVTFYGYKTRPIQVVLRIYRSPAEVLMSFDIDAASIGFDGNIVWTTDRCRRSLAHRANLIDVDRQSTTYEYRLYKYAKRGFAVSVPGYHHSKVKNELLNLPRVHTFSKIQKTLHGLSRLLIFNFACASKNPKHILGCYDDPNSVIAHLAEEKWANDLIFDEKTKPSDYFNMAVIKTYRYHPRQVFESIERARKVYNEKLVYDYANRHYFICTFNDIDTNLRFEKEPPCNHVPSYIEFITIEPGSQTPIGSFNPKSDNFFKSAYSKLNQADLDLACGRTVIWLKSAFGDKEMEKDSNPYFPQHDCPKELNVSKYILLRDLGGDGNNKKTHAWFETYDPQVSSCIEHAFRLFLAFGTSCEFIVGQDEIIDFLSWSVRYGPSHPLHPNQSSSLYRKSIYYHEDESSTNSNTSDMETTNKPPKVSQYSYY